MKGWSTFFSILAFIALIVGVLCFFSTPFTSIAVLFSSLSLFYASSLCRRITDMLDNQKKILDNQNEILSNQDKLRVMITNLDQ